MPSITFLKQSFQAFIAPGNDEEFLRLIQEADIRLLEMGRWRWCRTRTVLTPVDGLVTLEPQHASILGVQVGNYPADIKSEEYEFMPDGVGDIQIGTGSTRLIDQGINESGERYYKVTGGLRDGDTLTALVLYAPVTLYDPDLPDSGVPDDAVDTTLCPSAAALKLACFGIRYEENHDLSASERYFARANQTLDDNEQNQRGNARQTLSIRPNGAGIRRIRNFR